MRNYTRLLDRWHKTLNVLLFPVFILKSWRALLETLKLTFYKIAFFLEKKGGGFFRSTTFISLEIGELIWLIISKLDDYLVSGTTSSNANE